MFYHCALRVYVYLVLGVHWQLYAGTATTRPRPRTLHPSRRITHRYVCVYMNIYILIPARLSCRSALETIRPSNNNLISICVVPSAPVGATCINICIYIYIYIHTHIYLSIL